MDEKAGKNIVELLIEKTKEKKLEWKRGSSHNSFKVDLNSATVVVTYFPVDEKGPSVVHVGLFNGTGSAITLMHAQEGDELYTFLINLYSLAKDSCTKESETLENLLGELGSL